VTILPLNRATNLVSSVPQPCVAQRNLNVVANATLFFFFFFFFFFE